jgi:hypothetical protein
LSSPISGSPDMVAVESRIAPRPHFMLVTLDVADLQECPEGLGLTHHHPAVKDRSGGRWRCGRGPVAAVRDWLAAE